MSCYKTGLVSVIMPTYKRLDKLTRAIESVLKQSYKNLELLLVNDNNPDDDYTKELLELVSVYRTDERFKLVLQDRHINGAVARNVGIKISKGEYIAFLDDDDWWEEDKLQIQITELEKLSEEWGGVSCRIKRYYNNRLVAIQPLYKEGYVYKDVMMLVSDFETGTLVLRHSDLDQTRCFDEKLLRHQDLQLLVDFTYKYKLKVIDEALHCRDISDAQNRPNTDKIKQAKTDFFKSIKPIWETLTEKEKRDVELLNNIEIAYVQIKNKEYFSAFRNMLPILTSFNACKLEMRKAVQKSRSVIDAQNYI